MKQGEVVESRDDRGVVKVRRPDGKLETRYPVGGSSEVPDDVKAGAVPGRVESKIGGATASVASSVSAGGVAVEVTSGKGAKVQLGAPRLVVRARPVVPMMEAAPQVGSKKPAPTAPVPTPERVVAVVDRPGVVAGKGVSFDGFLGAGSKLALEVTSAGVKEVITMGSRPAEGEGWEFRSKVGLTGLNVKVSADGRVEFVDGTGVVAFAAPQGVMWDSSSADRDLRRTSSVTVVMDGDELVLLPDMAWLRDPKTVFPVFVDPTLTVEATRRVYVEQNNPNTAFVQGAESINGGYQGNVARTFERIDTSQLATGTGIQLATLNSRLLYCEPSYTSPVKFSKVTSGWGGPEGNLIANASFEVPAVGNTIGGHWLGSDTLPTGSMMAANDYLRSADSRFVLILQGDGNLVLYGPGNVAVWSSGTSNQPVARAVMQSDGNFVLYRADWSPVWWTGSLPGNNASFKVGNDGNLVVANAAGVLWQAGPGNVLGAFDSAVDWVMRAQFVYGRSQRTTAASMTLGEYGERLTAASGTWMAIGSAPFAVVPGEPLFVQMNLRQSDPASWAVARVEYYSAVPATGWNQMTDNQVATFYDPLWVHPGTVAQLYSASVAVPPSVKWARLTIHHNGPQLDVDNVKVLRNGNSLVGNPGFESGGLAGWSQRSGAGTSSIAAGSPSGFGTNVLSMSANAFGAWNAVGSTPFTVRPGEQLFVSGRLTGVSGGLAVVRVEYYDHVPAAGWDQFTDAEMFNNFDGASPPGNAPTGVWANLSATTVVPANAKYARLTLHHTGTGTSVQFDNMQISRPNVDANPYATTWWTQPPVTDSRVANNQYQQAPFGVDITTWVQDWINAPASNFGVRIDMDGSNNRCSLNGGYLSVIYNEAPLVPPEPTAANILVNKGFESGPYQWYPCTQGSTTTFSVESEQSWAPPLNRFAKVTGNPGNYGLICQRTTYSHTGYGDDRITMTAKFRAKQPGMTGSFMMNQQGNPNLGAKYWQALDNEFPVPENAWITRTITMCETSASNEALSMFVGTHTPNGTVYVDDVTMIVVRDSRPYISGGCTPPPPPTPPSGGGGGSGTPGGPAAPLEGAHFLEHGVPTTLEIADDLSCVALDQSGIAILTTDKASCIWVTPLMTGIGFRLAVDDLETQCLGRIGNGLALSSCQSFTDETLVTDYPGATADLRFPIRGLPQTNGAPSTCLARTGNALTFQPCSGLNSQMWFDASAPTPVFGNGGYNRTAAVAFANAFAASAPNSSWVGADGKGYDQFDRNDCVFFVSTALLQGGLVKNKEWNNKHRQSWLGVDHAGSPVWGVVNKNFPWLTRQAPSGKPEYLGLGYVATESQLIAGDVVYFVWHSDSTHDTASHVAIVVGRNSRGQIVIAHHNDGLNGLTNDTIADLLGRAYTQGRTPVEVKYVALRSNR